MKKIYLTTMLAIAAIAATAQSPVITDFESLPLDNSGFWNGSDESGGFQEGLASFSNNYNPNFASWNGFAYANLTNDTTPDFGNQYSAYAGEAYNSPDQNHGVAFVATDFGDGSQIPLSINFTDQLPHVVNGLYITNSTYTALSMRDGDQFAKQFGGPTGDDPDFLKIQVWGVDQIDQNTDTLEFFLADYRSADNTEDYIIKEWTWFDLANLGEVKSIGIQMASSDVGSFGINTPTYFCFDNLEIEPSTVASINSSQTLQNTAVYPNPVQSTLYLQDPHDIVLMNNQGQVVMQDSNVEALNLENLPAGLYTLQLIQGDDIGIRSIVKE